MLTPIRRALIVSSTLLAGTIAVGSVFALDLGSSSATPLPILSSTSVNPQSLVPEQNQAGPDAGQVVESVAPTTGEGQSTGGATIPAATSSSAPPASSTSSQAPISTAAGDSGPEGSDAASPTYAGGFYKGSKSSPSVGAVAPAYSGGFYNPSRSSGAGVAVPGVSDAGGDAIAGLVGEEAGSGSMEQESESEGDAASSDAASRSLVPTAVPGPGLGGILVVVAGVVISLAVARRRHG